MNAIHFAHGTELMIIVAFAAWLFFRPRRRPPAHPLPANDALPLRLKRMTSRQPS